MTRQKLKALLSRFSSSPVFNISSTVWIFAPEGTLCAQDFLYRCSAFLLFQDRLVWYCRGIWSREEDQPTQCLVSHCQCRCPPGSHPQNQVLSTGQLLVVIVMIFTYLWMFSRLTSGWRVPAKTICFPSTWRTSFYPALSSTPLWDPCWPTWPSTDSSSSLIQKPRKKSQFSFLFYLILWCTHSVVFHHRSRTVSSDTFIGNPMRTWASSLCVYLLSRELELQRKSSATDIAKKKQEAESAVSTGTRKQAVIRCVCGIIDHCLWVLLSSLCWENFLLFALLHPSSILFLFLLPWLLCRFCWCRNLWGES